MESSDCLECRRLLDRVAKATERHIHAISRLQAAIINNGELLPALEIVVKDASRARDRAQEVYRQHQDRHRVMQAGMGA